MAQASQEIEGVQEIPEVNDVRDIQEARSVQEEAVIVQQITCRAPTSLSLGTWEMGIGCAINIRLHWSMFFVIVLSLIRSWISKDMSALRVYFNLILHGPLLFITVLMVGTHTFISFLVPTVDTISIDQWVDILYTTIGYIPLTTCIYILLFSR